MEKNLKKLKEQWQKDVLDPILEKQPLRRENFFTHSRIDLPDVLTPEDSFASKTFDVLGFPGDFPYTRGVQPAMYRSRFWTMRQYAGFGSAEESNRRFRYLLEAGQTGLSVAFDLPTQMGYDSDSGPSQGEVGRVGVAIDTIDDLDLLFHEIPLDKVSVSMTINATAAILLAMYVVLAKRRGISSKVLRGTIQNDILKEYIARGTFIYPPRPSMRITTDIFEYCSESTPLWNTISISGYHIREAGSTASQEVAFTLANGLAYVEAALSTGLDIDSFAPRLSFFFGSHNNLLEEIAKFRAARRLWAKLIRKSYNPSNPASLTLRFHTQTCGCTLTAQQPENNIVRVAIQALASVLGGTQSLHTNSYDEALGLPTQHTATVALRTQQILAEETGVANTIDPTAGAYTIEYLTDKLEEQAMAYITEIENLGGAVQAIEKGYQQQQIHESAYRYQKGIDSGEIPIVGLNIHDGGGLGGEPIQITRPSKVMEKDQIKRLRKARKKRNQELVHKTLEELKNVAKGKDNLMPYIIASVEACATVGEISDVLREVFGTYKVSR